jgi:hypothetical protein
MPVCVATIDMGTVGMSFKVTVLFFCGSRHGRSISVYENDVPERIVYSDEEYRYDRTQGRYEAI